MRRFLSVLVLAASMAIASSAMADTPVTFVQSGQQTLTQLLKQPASATRDAALTQQFDKLVDYNELTKRCFRDDWSKLTPAQQTQVTDLIHKLVEKNYKKNLTRTLQYNVTYSGSGAQGTDTRVKTEATNTSNARDTVQIDYLVTGTGAGPFKIVDIITENSRLTTNYFRQFVSLWKKGAEKDAPERIKTALKKAIAKQ